MKTERDERRSETVTASDGITDSVTLVIDLNASLKSMEKLRILLMHQLTFEKDFS